MRLSKLAAQVSGSAVLGGGHFEVSRIIQDSRTAGPGDLFVAIRGLHSDGHDSAAAAAAKGAAVAVERPLELPGDTPLLMLKESRRGLGGLAAAIHGWPARRLKTIGITGTAGKTTSTHMTAHVLNCAGLCTGYLSTVINSAPGLIADNESGQTTMEAQEVQAWLAMMADAGAAAAVIEASSHSLAQERVAACEFDVAAVTNIAMDHLAYHGTPRAYLRAKARLIEICASAIRKGAAKTAVLNRDDSSYAQLAEIPIETRLSYGVEHLADLQAVDLEACPGATTFRLRTPAAAPMVHLRLPGRFNVGNALCAAAVCHALGIPADLIAEGLSTFTGLRGRLEPVQLGQPFSVYVDYAHSALGLRSVLEDLRREAAGRLLCVFGASSRSGGHDPVGMGRAAARLADFFVISTDDPGQVDPRELARQVEAGVRGRTAGDDYEVILDRRLAIRTVMQRARPGDVVLLAGKGHERAMLLAAGPEPWDERAEAELALRELGLAGWQN
jgi:UDP-N-acetylmuramoyl-L-alanyl-D-glutamate--2,6-diaminopimelate ligase